MIWSDLVWKVPDYVPSVILAAIIAQIALAYTGAKQSAADNARRTSEIEHLRDVVAAQEKKIDDLTKMVAHMSRQISAMTGEAN